jgi:hypothetical protein
MKIGIDAREIQDGVVTGIGRSLANFIRYFARSDTGHELVLFSERGFQCDVPETVTRVIIPSCPTFHLGPMEAAPGAYMRTAHRPVLFALL